MIPQPLLAQGTLDNTVARHAPVPLAATRGQFDLVTRYPQGQQMAPACARTVSRDAGKPRSDFDIGDGHGVTCDRAFVDTVFNFLTGFGYDVTVNKHFAGAESIHKHGNPSNGVHSLQIETRRGLYMNEVTYEKRTDFETVRGHLGQLTAHLADYARQQAQG